MPIRFTIRRIGAIVGQPVNILGLTFANPMEVICSSIQAASRLGYQESAELCAQYLAPVLDAIKFNYLPFGLNPFITAATLPKEIAYSEPRLQPPPGYKDTTVPGIWVPDTPLSHRNTQHGWIVAPGMQGRQGGSDHGGLADPRLACRTHGRTGHRTGPIEPANPAGAAERIQRGARSTAVHRPAGPPGADTAAAARAGGDPRSGRTDAGAGPGTRWTAAAR